MTKNSGNVILPKWFLFWCLIFLNSCASYPAIQPQVNAYVVANRLEQAIKILETQKNTYGPKNKLLYLLDKGFILHLAGRYEESVNTLEAAKRFINELYTKSVSAIAATWMINDYYAPYKGEHFEHVLVNIIQALNFAALGNFAEALVEARDVDRRLSVIAQIYNNKQKAVYKEDAFARLLMGILYETTTNPQDLNDAFISYQKALHAYESDFYQKHKMEIPTVLKENLLAASKFFGFPEFYEYRNKFPKTHFLAIEEKATKAQIYLIQYNGLSPLKHPSILTIPLPGVSGIIISKLSFPQYDERYYETASSILTAASETYQNTEIQTDLSEDIESIAQQDLESRRAGVYAKAIGRPIVKFAGERILSKKAKERYGKEAGYGAEALSSFYNLFSEQADLRSWQTLPAQIRIARLILEPGKYHLLLRNFDSEKNLVEENNLGEAVLKAGDTKFIITRSVH